MFFCMVAEGQRLADRFRLESVVDDGGAAALWVATDTSSGDRVALKVLSERLPDLQRFVGTFVAAGRRLSKAPHPAFVTVTSIGSTDRGLPFLVSDYIDGTSLRQLLETAGPLPVQRALRLIESVLQAMAAAHAEGAVHGDIKPSNLVLPADGTDSDSLRILNLGLSSPMIAAPGATMPEAIVGVLDYTAPERLREPGAAPTAAGDVFACGVIMSEMLMGQLPLAPLNPEDPTIDTKIADRNAYYMSGHAVPPPSMAKEDLSPAVVEVIHVATNVEPSRRFADAAQMLEALHVANESTETSPGDKRRFLEAETLISDPPFDLAAFREEHRPPDPDEAPDQRATVIFAEETTFESSADQDTLEISPLDDDAPHQGPLNPLGDPFKSGEPPMVDLSPQIGDSASEELKTETYRSPKPPAVPMRGPLYGPGLADVKTAILDQPDDQPGGLDDVPTTQFDPGPRTQASPTSAAQPVRSFHTKPTSSSAAPDPEPPAVFRSPPPEPAAAQLVAVPQGGFPRMTLILAVVALLGALGLGLAVMLWLL